MLQNRKALMKSPIHETALDCVSAAIKAASPERATRSNVSLNGETLVVADTEYDLTNYEDVLVVGGGKAGHGVASALESILGDRITDGIVVTKHSAEGDRVNYVTGDHPLPTDRNSAATATLLDRLSNAGAETLVLFVITGGASALLTSPPGELTIDDVRSTTEALLEGGVPIGEINAVRKHLSNIKGGQAAQAVAPATVATLVISDVVGNDLSVIGSGPTVPDETTFSDAAAVFEQYDITPPEQVANYIGAGVNGRVSETPGTVSPVFDNTENHLISDNSVALAAARRVARDAGYTPVLLTSRLRGEASEISKAVLAVAEECIATGNPAEPPVALLAGGESTVTVSDEPGDGGPNQEFALASALEITGRTVVAAVDTDGEDGSSDVAGAIADCDTVDDPELARRFLDANDAGTYLAEADSTVRTGPTGTNVNDIVVVLVPGPA